MNNTTFKVKMLPDLFTVLWALFFWTQQICTLWKESVRTDVDKDLIAQQNSNDPYIMQRFRFILFKKLILSFSSFSFRTSVWCWIYGLL